MSQSKVETEATVPKVVKTKLFRDSCLSPRIGAAEEKMQRKRRVTDVRVHSNPSPGRGWLSLHGAGPEVKPLPPSGCPACSRPGLARRSDFK